MKCMNKPHDVLIVNVMCDWMHRVLRVGPTLVIQCCTLRNICLATCSLFRQSTSHYVISTQETSQYVLYECDIKINCYHFNLFLMWAEPRSKWSLKSIGFYGMLTGLKIKCEPVTRCHVFTSVVNTVKLECHLSKKKSLYIVQIDVFNNWVSLLMTR